FAQVYKFLAILVLLGTKGADGLFSAYVPENVHNIAQLNVAVHDELLRNGLYAEIVGEVADRKEACGIVMLDYTAYVHGDLFEAAIKPIEDYLLATNKRTVLNETLRMEVYKAMKATALAAHKADMRDLFAKRQASTPLHRPTKLKSFPNAGVVAFDIGMSLFGGFILESVEDSVEESTEREVVGGRGPGDLLEWIPGYDGRRFKVIVPDSTPDYSPNAMPYMGSDWIWLYSGASTLLPLLFSLFAAVFGATMIWKQFTSIRAMKKDYEEMMQWKDYYERHLMPKYPSIPNMYD
ncbi:hypothetical protein OSTOST_16009, partial [Ostertagia ostertagi]